MQSVHIACRQDETVYTAGFEEVRSVRKASGRYALGWASLPDAEGHTMRFPAIVVEDRNGKQTVYTVADWGANFGTYDLADPADVKDLSQSAEGAFWNPGSKFLQFYTDPAGFRRVIGSSVRPITCAVYFC